MEGDDLGSLIAERLELEDGDVVVISQKVVSKAEGRVVRLDDVEPSAEAVELAAGHDPRHLEVILRGSARCAHAPTARDCRDAPRVRLRVGRRRCVERARAGLLVLLPVDPDASAAAIREQIGERTGRDVGVIVSDSFGRPFRTGIVDVAIGVAGITPLVDWRGHVDAAGHELRTTVIAVADEIASAAELVMGKLDGVPAAVVRGLEVGGLGSARELVMPPSGTSFPRAINTGAGAVAELQVSGDTMCMGTPLCGAASRDGPT